MIADTGTGIKNEIMSKIFDPFFTTKEPGKGTGLGLSISYGIIHDHGGTIWVENNDWGGASFYIRLPVKTDMNDKPLPI
jgi:histidine kinase